MPAPASSSSAPGPLPGAGGAVWRDKLLQLLESTGEGTFGIDMNGCCLESAQKLRRIGRLGQAEKNNRLWVRCRANNRARNEQSGQ